MRRASRFFMTFCESGPGARPFDLAWARDVVRQTREADVACFVKQVGANFGIGQMPFPRLKNRKGGDMSEWPVDLRVREFPNAALRRSVGP